MIVSAVTALGLGKGIGLFFVWINEKLRKHYNPSIKNSELQPVPAIFFDKEFIRNLRLSTE